jgi:hypothetical protein
MSASMRNYMKQAGLVLLGTILALGTITLFSDDLRSQGQSYDDYEKLLKSVPVLLDDGQAQTTKDVMARSLLAFLERDTDASIAELSDDYSWNKISAKGAVTRASGLEVTYERTKSLYESDFFDNYLGLDSVPIAVIGNLGVQYEVEQFLKEDGSKEILKTLAIYEIKNGKLWRLWAFPPFLGDDDAQD